MASEDPAPEVEVVEPPPIANGIFTFVYSSLKVTSPPAPPVEEEVPVEGEEKGDDEKEDPAAPVPAKNPVYMISSTIEGPAADFWPVTSPEPNEDGTIPPPYPSQVPGMDATSLTIPCDDASISKFLTSYLVVSLLADGDKTVATAKLQLNTIISDTQPSVTLTFPEYGTVDLSVNSTDDLTDAMMGGAQLTIYHVEVNGLPEEWQVLPKFEPTTMTAADYHGVVKAYVNPPKAVGEDREEVDNPPSQTFSVALGAASTLPAISFGKANWTYVPLEDGPSTTVGLTEEEMEANKTAAIEVHEKEIQAAAEAAAAAVAEEDGDQEEKKGADPGPSPGEGEEEALWEPAGLPTTREVPTPQYKWSLTFDKPCPNGAFFMSADSISTLSGAPSDLNIPVTVVRFGTTTKFGTYEASEQEVVNDKKGKKSKGKGKGKDKDEADSDETSEAAWEVSGTFSTASFIKPGSYGSAIATPLVFEGEDEGRKSSTSTAQPMFSVKVAFSTPLVEEMSSSIESSSSMGDVVGERQWKPKEKPRDVAGEFRKEIGDFVEELANMIKEVGGSDDAFFNRVQTSGTFHTMKEKLRANVQLAANSRFRKAPADGSGHQAYCSELFTALNTQLNAVLINKFTANKAVDSELFPTPAVSFEKEFEMLALRAEEAAVVEDVEKALTRHEDRVALAAKAAETGDADGIEMLSMAWNEKAIYCLKCGLNDKAIECLKESGKVLPLTPSMMLLNAIAFLNARMYDVAEGAFEGALGGVGEDEGEGLVSTIHAGLCVLHSAVDELEKKTYDEDKESLRLRGLPMVTFPKRDLTRASKAKKSLAAASATAVNAPARRGGISALLSLAELMVDHKLKMGARRTLQIAGKCEQNSQAKEAERGLEPVNASYTYGLRSRLDCEVSLLGGYIMEGLAHAEASCRADESGLNYETLAKAYVLVGKADAAIEAYEKCLTAFTVPLCPLRVFLKLCLLLIDSNSDEGLVRAKDVAVLATKKFGSAMAWKLIGVALSELNEKEDAEAVLQESLRIDSFEPSSWAYLSLLLMDNGWGDGEGHNRLVDASVNARQAVLQNLSDPFLLRQLGARLFNNDELDMAEQLLRRSLTLSKASATRKMLGEVLRAQKKGEEALENFLALMMDDDFDAEEKRDLYVLILSDMKSLGKREEAREFRNKWAAIYGSGGSNERK